MRDIIMIVVQLNQEFTWTLVRDLPYINWMIQNGQEFIVESPLDYRSLLYNVNDDNIRIKRLKKQYHFSNKHEYYQNRLAPQLYRKWLPPKLKEYYAGISWQYPQPEVIINNKYISEWLGPPSIYIDIDTLRKIIEILSTKYTIGYIRSKQDEPGYDVDNMQAEPYSFNDYEVLRSEFPQVELLDDYKGSDYNMSQALFMAKSTKHIAVAGGNACFSAYFADDMIIKNSMHPKTKDRGIWKDNSWIHKLNNANIAGHINNKQIIGLVQTWI